jgi:hypothetical protein
MAEQDRSHESVVPARDLVRWIEVGAWLVLGYSPLLYLVHGPPVSAEQRAIQGTLVASAGLVVAIFGARRAMAWLRRT